MGRKHWEKEKLLVTSNFSFSYSVFKRLVSQERQKVSLCGNGLNPSKPCKELSEDNFKFDLNGGKFSKGVENALGKGDIARYEQFLLSLKCFQKTCTADRKKHGLVWERINPFPNKPRFSRACSTNLLKILWEKEKLVTVSNFSFSHSVFYLSGELSAVFIVFKIVVCKLFPFGRVRNSSFWKGLTVVIELWKASDLIISLFLHKGRIIAFSNYKLARVVNLDG